MAQIQKNIVAITVDDITRVFEFREGGHIADPVEITAIPGGIALSGQFDPIPCNGKITVTLQDVEDLRTLYLLTRQKGKVGNATHTSFANGVKTVHVYKTATIAKYPNYSPEGVQGEEVTLNLDLSFQDENLDGFIEEVDNT